MTENHSATPGLDGGAARPEAVSLDAVLSSDIPVAWDEAVSIVEAVCEAVQGSVPRLIPGAKEIFVTSSGTVSVRTGSGTPDSTEAARRLHELLGKGAVPAPLRLFASQAVRAGHHGSIAEFVQALGYFAKPGGQGRILAVYERCVAHVAAVPVPTDGKPSARTASSEELPPRPWGRWAVVGLVACLAAGSVSATGYFLWQGLAEWPPTSASVSVPERSPDAGDVASRPAPRGRRATQVATRSSSATEESGPGQRLVADQRTGQTPVAPGIDALGSEASPSREAIDVDVPEPRAEPAQPVESGDDTDPTSAWPSAAPSQAATPPRVPAAVAAVVDAEMVYSATDPGVVLATLVREQRLSPATVPSGRTQPLRMEVIVSAAGTVERARFLAAPQRMTDMMLLSSAKTWEFNPARKDGKPVRSRVILSWFVAP